MVWKQNNSSSLLHYCMDIDVKSSMGLTDISQGMPPVPGAAFITSFDVQFVCQWRGVWPDMHS